MFPMLDISLFDFHLPQELIAQYPPETRGQSRMMLLEHEGTRRRILPFTEIEKVLLPGDCLVLNNSRVIPARLYGKRRGSGGKIEILLLEPVDKEKHIWKAFVRPAR
ncbi:MAG: tRNA preQ1(34) S-adenosylmethionine ribosyltransferase-isomerase QueA, partial [Lentisphaerae bacterium]